MRVNVVVRGVPVGSFRLRDGDVEIAPLEPTAAYAAIQDEVQHHSVMLWSRGFLQQYVGESWEPGMMIRYSRRRVPVEALAPTTGMSFELRDTNGNPLHADFVNVVASPRATEPPVVVVCRKHAHAAIASLLNPSPRAQGNDERVD